MWKWQYDNKACACSSKREKAERAEGFGQIVECAAVDSKNTVRQFYEGMDKLGKCVCCACQIRGNVTKVG